MKIKTSELKGAALDWAVAKIEGNVDSEGNPKTFRFTGSGRIAVREFAGPDMGYFTPSTNWAQGGPIIERENIWTKPKGAFQVGERGEYLFIQTGPTPLVAAMRCFVASKLGDEVEILEKLLA